MEQIRAYLLSVIAAGVICAVVSAIGGKCGIISSLLKLMTGIFMAVTMISPLIKFRLPNIEAYMDAFSYDASMAVQTGQQLAASEISDIIKSRVEAYILDKANTFGAELTVEVILSEDQYPIPCGVKLFGSISPYGKLRLSQAIEEDLGIRKEDQIWIN